MYKSPINIIGNAHITNLIAKYDKIIAITIYNISLITSLFINPYHRSS